MPYLNVDLDYFDHPKVKRLVAILGENAELLPLKLWAYCGKYHVEDGGLKGYTPPEIEAIIGWKGEPNRAVNAMLTCELLDRDRGGIGGLSLRVHEWQEHEGHLVAFKVRARRASTVRWQKMRDATSMLQACSKESTSNAPTIPTIPSLTNHTITMSEAEGLAELLRNKILGNDPKAKLPKDLSSWIMEVEKVSRLDGRSKEEIHRVIEWSQTNSFWKSNILSMGKLREKFPQLYLKMIEETSKNANGKTENKSNAAPGKYDNCYD